MFRMIERFAIERISRIVPQLVRRVADANRRRHVTLMVEQVGDVLTDEAAKQSVSVLSTNPVPVIRINSRTMFEPGAVTVRRALAPLLE